MTFDNHRQQYRDKKQRGVALITALLIVSLTTIMAVSLASRQYMDVRRTGNIMLADQAYVHALALESFAMQLLKAYRANPEFNYDDLTKFQEAALAFQFIKVDEGRGSLSGIVEFPEAKFNVNTLIDKEGRVKEWEKDYYGRLLVYVLRDLGLNETLRDDLVDSLLDWLDPDQEARITGAEDSTYEGKDIPYKAANRMMSSISEIHLVEGYSKELLYGIPADPENDVQAVPGLLHYITAIPDRNSTININLIEGVGVSNLMEGELLPDTAALEVEQFDYNAKLIQALGGYIEHEMASELLAATPYESYEKFKNHEVFTQYLEQHRDENGRLTGNGPNMQEDISNMDGKIEMQSSYFLLKSTSTLGDSSITLNSLIYASTDGGDIEVVSRSIGTDGI